MYQSCALQWHDRSSKRKMHLYLLHPGYSAFELFSVDRDNVCSSISPDQLLRVTRNKIFEKAAVSDLSVRRYSMCC